METFSPSLVAFYLIGGAAVLLALFAVTAVNLVRATLGLAFSFFAVGGIFWLLGSPFLAVLQLVVNAGAIPIVTIFIVKMTRAPSAKPSRPTSAVLALLVAIPLLVATLLFVPSPATGGLGTTQVTPLSVERLGVELLSQRGRESTLSDGSTLTSEAGTLIAFEATAVVLLIAFVGAILLAQRTPVTESSTERDTEKGLADADA